MDITQQRSQILDNIAHNQFNFGKHIIVEDFSGWESLNDEHTRKVFYAIEGELVPDNHPSYCCNLTVIFQPNSVDLKDVYAITPDGNLFGHMPT